MGRLWFIEQMGVWTKLVCTHILQDGKMAVTLWFFVVQMGVCTRTICIHLVQHGKMAVTLTASA